MRIPAMEPFRGSRYLRYRSARFPADAGRMGLASVDFQLRESMEKLNALFGQSAFRKGVGYLCRINPEVPDRFTGDWICLTQILANLIGNAVKFTEAGRVAIEVSKVDQTDLEATLCFSISDTGPGIPDEQLNAIFELLDQSEDSRTRTHEGTGLGLYIAARLANIMGGHIFVQSREGEGTAFHLTVVLELQEAEALSGAGTGVSGPQAGRIWPES